MTQVAIDARTARRLLLHAQGLLEDPRQRVTPAAVHRLVERMGFVQLDSINVVARAHHLTLAARLDGYRPEHLSVLLERVPRRLFEHWTHDASALPHSWFAPWRHRCRRMAGKARTRAWLARRMGRDWPATLEKVLDRVDTEGPLRSKDFERPPDHEGASWWGWKPAKAALEYLWWRGDLSVAARVHFHKVYDLTSRCFPDHEPAEVPSEQAFVDWACREAMKRLVVATPKEVSDFHQAVSLTEARAWCHDEAAAGRLVPAQVEPVDGSRPRTVLALPDWRRRSARAEQAMAKVPDRMRFLSPFDPVLRDRARARRLFGFDYRFEAFVPAARRRHGYYVLPVLRGDRLVARADAKLHRKRGVLELRALYWEAGRGHTKKERRLLGEAAERLAAFVGADRGLEGDLVGT